MNKGCTNPDCNSNKKRKCYTQKDTYFCPECGNELSHICKECFTVLTDDSKKYCIRCEQERKDKQQRAFATAKKAGGALASFVLAAGAVIPQAFKQKK